LGDFFSKCECFLFLPKILDYEALLGTLGDALTMGPYIGNLHKLSIKCTIEKIFQFHTLFYNNIIKTCGTK
jgi:hypothetical protein